MRGSIGDRRDRRDDDLRLDGPNNGPGHACTSACATNVCGDGELGPEEVCDDGPNNGPGHACLTGCTHNVCGDLDVGPDETCDDGDADDKDGCLKTCHLGVVFDFTGEG